MTNNQPGRLWVWAAVLLLLFLIVQELSFVWNNPWLGDYWEHRAVLKALSAHTPQVMHPIIGTNLPHAFESPYLVMLGWIVFKTGLSAEAALNLAAIINLFLFFGAVWMLVQLFLPRKPIWTSYTLVLLLLLCGWGYMPPSFSAFYHLGTFPFVMGYPSTFSFICVVFAAWLLQRLLNQKQAPLAKLISSVSILFFFWISILSHPLSFLFGVALTIYVALDTQKIMLSKSLLTRLLITGAFLAISFGFAFFWPYYSLADLFSYISPGNQFHSDSRELYSSLLRHLYPLLLVPVLFFLNTKENWRNNLALIIAGSFLFLLFVYGFLSHEYGYGRMISFLAILAQLLLAKLLLGLPSGKLRSAVALVLLIACLPFLRHVIPFNLSVMNTSREEYINKPVHVPFEHTNPSEMAHRLRFLENHFQPGDLVLADTLSSKYLPGLGAHVIGSVFPAYWITDNTERMNAMRRFFTAEATAEERAAIINHYRPNYLLLTPATGYLLPRLSLFIDSQPFVSEKGISLYKIRINR